MSSPAGGVRLAIAITTLVCGPMARAQDREALAPETMEAISAEHWDRAAELLAPRAANEQDEEAQYWLGVIARGQGQPAEAASCFERALAARADVASARELASCALELGAPERAGPALRAFPDDAEVGQLVGHGRGSRRRTDHDTGALEQAIGHLHRAVRIDDEHAEANAWLAAALFEIGDAAQALRFARRAAALSPAGWETHGLMGTCLEATGRDEEAAAAFAMAATLAPADVATWRFREGLALERAGRFETAVAAFRTVLAKDPAHPSVRLWLGIAALEAGSYRLALWAFAESREVDGSTEALYWTGRCAYELGDYDNASRLIDEATNDVARIAPDEAVPPEWYHYLGRAQWGLDEHATAQANLQRAFDAAPTELLYARWLFRAHEAIDDPHGAIEVCRRLAEAGEPAVALRSLEHVQRTWPRPRTVDRHGQPAPAHTELAMAVEAPLLYAEGRYAAAAERYTWSRRHEGERACPEAGWALVLSEQPRSAMRAFEECIAHGDATAADEARLGLGYAYLLADEADAARAAFAAITRSDLVASRDAGLLCCDGGAAADAFTGLGLMGVAADGGVRVLAVLPGSLLEGWHPRIRAGDVLLAVGPARLRSPEDLERLRAAPAGEGRPSLLLRRGDLEFEASTGDS